MPIVKGGFLILSCLLISAILLPSSAYSELYIAGQIGGTFPTDLSRVKGTGSFSSFAFGDFKMSHSTVWGGKLGYFLETYRWLGLEVDAYTTTPHIKQQTVQATPSAIVNQPDVELRVTTVALNLVFRYPGEMLQPYIGAGPGYFNATGTGDFSDSTSGVGFNFIAGVRVFLISHLAIFGEYKRFAGTFKFDNAFGPGAGIKEDYLANHILGGVSFHF